MRWHGVILGAWSLLLALFWIVTSSEPTEGQGGGEFIYYEEELPLEINIDTVKSPSPLRSSIEPTKKSLDTSKKQKVSQKAEKIHSLISINSASTKELQTLPGIGEVLAGRIIVSRDSLGLFTSLDDLQRVKGIGVKTCAKLSQLITIE